MLKIKYVKIPDRLQRLLGNTPLLERQVLSLNNYHELMKVYGWDKDPIIDHEQVSLFEYPEDINQRRLRDAESIMTACRNLATGTFLEIGTAQGVTTAGMASNAPKATIYTINIPPEEAITGVGGKAITRAFEHSEVGAYYREKGLSNIKQIFANTATWIPDIGTIDLAFIDGCHDTEFVINDTLAVMPHIRPGGFILWHDSNLELAPKFHWISSVCRGLEWLCASGNLSGRIYTIRDSWVFIWQAPKRMHDDRPDL